MSQTSLNLLQATLPFQSSGEGGFGPGSPRLSEDDFSSINSRLELSFAGAILKLYFSVIFWYLKYIFFETLPQPSKM